MAGTPPAGVSASPLQDTTILPAGAQKPDAKGDAQFRALSNTPDPSPQTPPLAKAPDVPVLPARNPIVLAQLGAPGPVAAPRPQAAAEDIPPERKAAIDQWIKDKASPGFWASLWGDSEGGNLASALQGGTKELGRLSLAEQAYLLTKTVEHMRSAHSVTFSTDIAEFGRSMKGKGALSSRVAAQLAGMAADAMAKFLDNPKGGPVDEGAIAVAAVNAMGDNEPALRGMIEGLGADKAGDFGDALAAATNYGLDNDAASRLGQALTAMNKGPETEASRQFALHAFASAGVTTYRNYSGTGGPYMGGEPSIPVDIGPSDAAAPMAAAVARLMHPGDAAAQRTEEQRLTAVMRSKAGVKLFAPELGNDKASQMLRMQAFGILRDHPEISAESLLKPDSPWLTPALAQLAAAPTAQAFLERGDQAQEYRGTDLDNMIGTAMNRQPDKAPKNETPQQAAAREAAVAAGRYSYFDQEPVNLVRDAVRDADKAMGGDGSAPKVAVLPVQVATEDGPLPRVLFRVDREVNGKVVSQFVDDMGARFPSFEEWKQKNALPEGVMSYPVNGHLTAGADRTVQLATTDTPETHNTLHHVERYADKAVLIAGIAAATLFTGGLADLVVAGAGVYWIGRSVQDGGEMWSRNQSLNPVRSSQARSVWLNAAAGVTGAGSIAARTTRFLPALAEAGTITKAQAVRTALTANWIAMGASGAAFANGTVDLARNWDRMSPDQKIEATLLSAFWLVNTARGVQNAARWEQRYAWAQRLAQGQQGAPGGPAGGARPLLAGAPGEQAPGALQSPPRPLAGAPRDLPPPAQQFRPPMLPAGLTPPEQGVQAAGGPEAVSSGLIVPAQSLPPDLTPAQLDAYIRHFNSLPKEVREQLGGSPIAALAGGAGLQIYAAGESRPSILKDGHRHALAFDGRYAPWLADTDMNRSAELQTGVISDIFAFTVAPHMHVGQDGNQPGLDLSDPTRPIYYLAMDGQGGRVVGKIKIEGNSGRLVEGYAAGLHIGEPYSRQQIEQFIGFSLPPGNFDLPFVSTPIGVALGYHPGADQRSLEVVAKQIRAELDAHGHSPTAERLYVGLLGGNPTDPAASRLFWKNLAYANKLERDLGLPPGSIQISGAGEETISKETISHLVGMPSFSGGGQAVLDAFSQMVAPWRFAGGITIIHCDAGDPAIFRDPRTGTGITPGNPNINVPFQGPSRGQNIDNLIKLMDQNPDQQFIWAHAGASLTSSMPSDYFETLEKVLVRPDGKLRPNVKIDLSWDITNRWIRGNDDPSRPNAEDPNRIKAWAAFVAKYPTSFLWGSDTIAAASKPTDTSAAVFAELETMGFIRELSLAGRARGNPNILEQFQSGNFDNTIKASAKRVTQWRTNPEVAAWLAGPGPEVANPVPPLQWVHDPAQSFDDPNSWRLVRTETLGPLGNRNTQILPATAQPLVGTPGIVWTNGRWVNGLRNPLRMGDINQARRDWLRSQGINVP